MTERIIVLFGSPYNSNDVRIVKETSKAIQVQIVGDKRFISHVGLQTWFPKSALEFSESGHSATVKPWFIPKLNRFQEYACGRAE